MNKKWYEVIDFYRLTALVLIWVSAWIFMIPWKQDITTPYFENVWGSFLAFFGAVKEESVYIQQLPDFFSGVFSLFLIIILHFKGILTITTPINNSVKKHKSLIIFLNVISIIVHTLFFAMLIKVSLFPNTQGSNSSIEQKKNLYIMIFATVCITGMILGGIILSKIFILIFSIALLFFNITFISSIMGLWGFVAIVLSAIGFYLEFCVNGFNKKNLLIELNYISGKYDNFELKGKNYDKIESDNS